MHINELSDRKHRKDSLWSGESIGNEELVVAAGPGSVPFNPGLKERVRIATPFNSSVTDPNSISCFKNCFTSSTRTWPEGGGGICTKCFGILAGFQLIMKG